MSGMQALVGTGDARGTLEQKREIRLEVDSLREELQGFDGTVAELKKEVDQFRAELLGVARGDLQIAAICDEIARLRDELQLTKVDEVGSEAQNAQLRCEVGRLSEELRATQMEQSSKASAGALAALRQEMDQTRFELQAMGQQNLVDLQAVTADYRQRAEQAVSAEVRHEINKVCQSVAELSQRMDKSERHIALSQATEYIGMAKGLQQLCTLEDSVERLSQRLEESERLVASCQARAGEFLQASAFNESMAELSIRLEESDRRAATLQQDVALQATSLRCTLESTVRKYDEALTKVDARIEAGQAQNIDDASSLRCTLESTVRKYDEALTKFDARIEAGQAQNIDDASSLRARMNLAVDMAEQRLSSAASEQSVIDGILMRLEKLECGCVALSAEVASVEAASKALQDTTYTPPARMDAAEATTTSDSCLSTACDSDARNGRGFSNVGGVRVLPDYVVQLTQAVAQAAAKSIERVERGFAVELDREHKEVQKDIFSSGTLDGQCRKEIVASMSSDLQAALGGSLARCVGNMDAELPVEIGSRIDSIVAELRTIADTCHLRKIEEGPRVSDTQLAAGSTQLMHNASTGPPKSEGGQTSADAGLPTRGQLQGAEVSGGGGWTSYMEGNTIAAALPAALGAHVQQAEEQSSAVVVATSSRETSPAAGPLEGSVKPNRCTSPSGPMSRALKDSLIGLMSAVQHTFNKTGDDSELRLVDMHCPLPSQPQEKLPQELAKQQEAPNPRGRSIQRPRWATPTDGSTSISAGPSILSSEPQCDRQGMRVRGTSKSGAAIRLASTMQTARSPPRSPQAQFQQGVAQDLPGTHYAPAPGSVAAASDNAAARTPGQEVRALAPPASSLVTGGSGLRLPTGLVTRSGSVCVPVPGRISSTAIVNCPRVAIAGPSAHPQSVGPRANVVERKPHCIRSVRHKSP